MCATLNGLESVIKHKFLQTFILSCCFLHAENKISIFIELQTRQFSFCARFQFHGNSGSSKILRTVD